MASPKRPTTAGRPATAVWTSLSCAFYAPAPPHDDGEVIALIEGYIRENPRHGFDKMYATLRAQGCGKSRLYRVYRQLKLNLKRRGKRRLPARIKVPLQVPATPNAVLVDRLHG